MSLLWNLGVGILGGIAGSLVVSIGSSVMVGFPAHALEAFPWLFLVSVVPAGLGGVALGLSAKPSWPVALFVALVVVAASGSVGAIAVESAQRGIDQVNVTGYLLWCLPYGIALLPIAAPLAYVGSRLARRQNS